MHILILGGNSDIGLAIARTYAEKEGASLTLASRDTGELERNASDLSIRYGVEVDTVRFDACDFDAHRDFYKQLENRPDGVVLAFGYNGDQERAQADAEEQRTIIETNFLGAASILRVVAEDFEVRANRDGESLFIIGLSSVAGERGRKANYVYGSSKAGLSAYLSGLRQRLAPQGIQVVTVKPGYVDTKMTAGMDLPGPLVLSPDKVARKTYSAWKRGKSVTYVTWYWRVIITLVKMVPERLFKRLEI
ncbi:MAG: SDR family oxidoreductase [Balneolaceae bacterium]|nr:SDR family oxidoreductase [Balneolaceae bacterium]